jgi:hypothetical protein
MRKKIPKPFYTNHHGCFPRLGPHILIVMLILPKIQEAVGHHFMLSRVLAIETKGYLGQIFLLCP